MKTRQFIALAAAPFLLGAAPAIPAAPVSEEIPVGMLKDLSTGQTLFARETQRRFVPASVTKVMTAYTAFKLFGDGRISPGTLLRRRAFLQRIRFAHVG